MSWIKKHGEQITVFLVSYLFFLLTLAENFSGPHDSINYLNGIVKGHPLINQHHLLYHVSAHYWLRIFQPLFPGVYNYYIIEAFTALWGSGSLVIVYCFFRKRFNLAAFTCIAGTAVVAFSYGFWFYSVNIEVYAPPLFFILLALYVMTRPQLKKGDITKIIILHILAILFHQINILFGIIVLYKLWVERKQINLVKAIAGYALAGLILVGGAYFYAGWIVEGQDSFARWTSWMKGYARQAQYWQPLNAKTPAHVAIGYSHAFIGGHFIFQIPELHTYIDKSLGVHSLHDELFLTRNSSPTFVVVLSSLAITIAILMISMIVRFILKLKTIVKGNKKLILPIVYCGAVYSIFFCFWMPEILEFWILQSVLLWLLLIGTVPIYRFPLQLKTDAGIVFLVIAFFTVNYFGSIRPLMKKENDWYYHKVIPIMNKTTPNDLVLLQDGWILKDFMDYFGKAKVMPVPWKDSLVPITNNAITHSLENKGKIYVYPEANNMKIQPNTRYIDSVLHVFSDRKKVYHEGDPLIIVIE